MLTRNQCYFKRIFDLVISLLLLIPLFPLILIGWTIASIETKKNGFFLQSRIGRFGKKFKIIKLRTMRDSSCVTNHITVHNDPRITRFGRIFRKLKIDEFPQLLNVIIGQMSLVGPRPDVEGFADLLIGEYRSILHVRPGITGPASIYFRNEEELLSSVKCPAEFNREFLWSKKIYINFEYINKYKFTNDLIYLYQTLTNKGHTFAVHDLDIKYIKSNNEG